MGFIDGVKERAKLICPTIVWVEGGDAVVAEAAVRCQTEGISKNLVLGTPEEIAATGVDVSSIKTLDITNRAADKERYAQFYEEHEDFPAEAIVPMLDDPLNYACMMLAAGDVDGMIGGHIYSTPDVISAASMFVGLKDGVSTPCCYDIMDVPDCEYGEGGLVVVGDPAMVVQPNAEELADIAVSIGQSVRDVCGFEPKVAMISFSTSGSASAPDVQKVTDALALAREKAPELLIDGEMQVDAALVPAVARKKIKGENLLEGQANVLIFPDLDAGNAACKLIQLFGKANIYGAVMCGYAKPLSDLSRGMGVDDLVGMCAIVAAQVER